MDILSAYLSSVPTMTDARIPYGRLLVIAGLAALADLLLTRSAQASLFFCSSDTQACNFLAQHQTLLSLLNFPASQLALHFHHGLAAHWSASSWLWINAALWGVATFILGCVVSHLRRTVR